MRTDLPWNVAGIPTEAREAARAAARREGLSVGEWLTRRILRSFAEAREAYAPVRESWSGMAEAPRHFEEPVMMMANLRNTQDMLARVSRSEAETQNAYRKIEDQLRNLARRLDSSERSQSEHSRAMHDAAAEINLASREQAEAFEQLGAHVIGLGERIDRIEERVATDESDEVVKGLHDGLSRVADQVADTANQSASQIASLATTLEAVVGKMNEAHEQAATSATVLGQRISLIDERVRAMETTAHVKVDALERTIRRIESEKSSHGEMIEKAVAGIEGTHTALRSEVKQGLQALDVRYAAKREELEKAIKQLEAEHQTYRDDVRKTIEELENRFATAQAGNAENERHAQLIQQMEETINRLSDRIAAHETSTANTVARLEEGFARLEGLATNGLDQRVDGVERVVETVASRIESVERNSTSAISNLEDSIKGIGTKLDHYDRNNRDAIEELRATLQNTTSRLEIIEGVPAAAPSPADQPASSPSYAGDSPAHPATFDPPPFGPETKSNFQGSDIHRAFGTRTEAFQTPPAEHEDGEEPFHLDQPLAAESLDSPVRTGDGEQFLQDEADSQTDLGESYLLSARRSASTAIAMDSDEMPMRSTLGGFTWGARQDEPEPVEEPQQRSRTLIIGIIALIAILAVALGVAFSQHFGRPASTTPTAPAAATPHKAAKLPVTKLVAAKPSPQKAAPANAAPHASAKPAAAPVKKASAATPVKASATDKAPPAKPAPSQAAASTQPDRLTKLADGGNAKAQLLMGLKYLDGDGVAVNDAIAAKWLQSAADQGEPVAEYRLGTLYERGRGVKEDLTKATHWYQAAAKQGNRKAMHNLAVAYAEGHGTQKNFAEAAHWFARAAQLGLADSQFNLAVLYERGLGVPQSLGDAYKWYAIAAAQGDKESAARVSALATQLDAKDRESAEKAAASFKPDAMSRAANAAPEMPRAEHG